MRRKKTTTLKAWPREARKIFAMILGLCLIWVFIGGVKSQPATASEQISAEVSRLKQLLPSLNLPEDEAKQYSDGLARVETVLRSGRVLLSFYYLQAPHINLMTYVYQKSKADVAKQGREAFEAEWQKLGQQLAAKEKLITPESLENMTAAARAITEAALGQVHPYYQSGRLYGLNTTFDNGLYYLGRAPAFQELALYSQQLHLTPPHAALKLRSLEPELSALEAETLAAYQQSADKDLRPFITTNVTLKVAGELNQGKLYFGALLKYLDASLALKLLKATPPNEEQQAALKKQHEAFGKQLSLGKTDHSLGLIYWEMAQRALQPAPEDTIGPEDLKRAAVVINEVLPRYFKVTAKVTPKS